MGGTAGAGGSGAATGPEILLGMSAAFSGAHKELGRGMKIGFELALSTANESGGIAGRKLGLVALDDGDDPARSPDAMRELIEGRRVFAVLGSVGSAGAAAAIPVAMERKVLFFGAVGGIHRSPPDRYVFSFRAGYAEEVQAATRYLTTVRRFEPEELAFFSPDDADGQAGWAGLVRELERQGKKAGGVLRTSFRPDSLDVSQAVAKVRKRGKRLRGVVMVATHEPAVRFMSATSRSRLVYTHASAVESAALSEGLLQARVPIRGNVVVTQVVPLPSSQSTAVIKYRQLLAARAQGEPPASLSLEGYLTGLLFIEGLKRAGPDLDTEKLVDALESLRDVDLGIGVRLGFGPKEHQASHKVWGTALQKDGTYRAIDLE